MTWDRHKTVSKVSRKNQRSGHLGQGTGAFAPAVMHHMNGSFVDFTLLARATEDSQMAKAGEIIFREGDNGAEFFVVKSGSVAIRHGNKTLQVLGEGEIFGEMALIDSEPRSATVVAETDAVIVPVSEKQFLFMTSEAPYFALNVMRVLAKRLRTSNNALPGG